MADSGGQLTAALVVHVDGTELSTHLARLVETAHVDDSRDVPGMFELRLRDPDHIAIQRGGFRLGAKLRIAVRTGLQSAPIWIQDSEITALEVEYDGTGSWTVVRGYDARHRLFRGLRVASYRDMTVAQIVEAVAKEAGMALHHESLSGPRLTEVVQANTSDWDFLRGLAQDVGLALNFRDGKIKLEAPKAAAGGIKLRLGEHITRLRVAVSASGHVGEVKVRAWNPKTKNALVGASSVSKSATTAIGVQPSDVAAPFGKRTLTVSDAPHVDSADVATKFANALAEEMAGSFAELDAVVRGNAALRAGGSIELQGVGQPFEGRYVISRVRHVFDSQDGYQSWITVAGGNDRSLLGLAVGSGNASGQILGLMPAIVTDTKDPDKLGRVRVNLPGLDDELQTTWARPIQHGGKGGGGIMLPEVDDEVLVGFAQGRIEHPFVLGGLYNGVDKPPPGDLLDNSTGSICRRSVASRSGNRVELIDVPNGANGVLISTGDNKMTVNLDRKGTTIKIASAGKIEISGDKDITIRAGGNAAIESNGNITLKAKGNLSAEAANIAAKAKSTLDLTANGAVSISGQGKAELKSAGQTSVSGAQAEFKAAAVATIAAPLVKIN